jgi:EAL domain-containing protein (putative c-di-GMP-specific phosphodiesterase class I)
MSTHAVAATWYLESYATDSGSLWRFALHDFPVRVGRRAGIGLSLLSPLISHDHAEIDVARGGLQVRDLGSTNGTFVNGARIATGAATRVKKGDVLHFANVEFLVGRLAPGESAAMLRTRTSLHHQLPRRLIDRARHLNNLLQNRIVVSTWQPIVHLHSGDVAGYELLGRGAAGQLPKDPEALFELANTLGLAGELSRLFRAVAARYLRHLPGHPVLFFNTHPAELDKPELLESLQSLRRALPGAALALEVHEQAATNPQVVHALRRALEALDIRLAYDDFGAGRSRINELVEVPPDYLKFDETLIRGIDSAPNAKRKLLRALVRMCQESSIQTLAEGVETRNEARALRELGFDLGQGYLVGKPKPLGPRIKSRGRRSPRKSKRRSGRRQRAR